MEKTTVIAPSNVAFIKYWGRNNEDDRLPANGSVSMNLSNLFTTTTVAFDETLQKDVVIIDGEQQKEEAERVTKHLDKIRDLAGEKFYAKVVSVNSFPKSCGLSSSASGFAALTYAATKALKLDLSEKELSILARLGSGSACRSIPSGFVEWQKGESSKSSYAVSLFPPTHWDICDVVVVVSDKKKYMPTSVSQKSAYTSPFFEKRLSLFPSRIEEVKKLIQEKNFVAFGQLIEQEAFEFHAMLMTMLPPHIYLLSETVALLHFVQTLRKNGLLVYCTLNTGHNVHLLCQAQDEKKLLLSLQKFPEIQQVISNKPSGGARLTSKHLF